MFANGTGVLSGEAQWCVFHLSPILVFVGILALTPYLGAAFWPNQAAGCVRKFPLWIQIGLPSLLCLPYLLVSAEAADFRWGWLLVYAALPIGISWSLWATERSGGGWSSGWVELGILLSLGLAVDLRWLERAWPPHLAVFNKILLLDSGVYGFVFLKPLPGVGFDLRVRLRDLALGLREFVLYVPMALVIGLGLDFLHLHAGWPGILRLVGAWLFTFFLIAVPEELFFRGWLQNLLERWMGRCGALTTTAVLFGLSHFNKRTAFFNWKYVLLATIAGVFYGRAWRPERRVGASAITHASVDAVWSLWLR